MLVSAIRQTSPGRFSVILDEAEDIKSTLAVVTDHRLFTGKELDEQELAQLKTDSLRALARERALEMLSRRPMSRKELYQKLVRKGEDEDTAQYCAAWLEENKFIDDESYAAALARHYAAKGYGPGRLRSELSRRGIDRELWEDAVDNMPQDDDKIDKFIVSRLKDPEDREQVRKISSALFRRGYSWDEIRSALRRHEAQTEDY